MSEVKFVRLDSIRPSKRNVRRIKNDAALSELMASIQEHGLLQPLLVRDLGEDYEVIAGNRRLKALQQLHGENNALIPVHVAPHELSSAQLEEMQLAENLVRSDMHPAETAASVRRLLKAGARAADVAAHFGRPEPWVTRQVALADLHSAITQAWLDGKIDASQAASLTLVPKGQYHAWLEKALEGWDGKSLHRAILKEAIPAKNALFDLAKYPKAAIRTDLFGEDVWLTDREAFMKLQQEELEKIAERFRNEGWERVEIRSAGSGALPAMCEMEPENWPAEIAEERARLEAVFTAHSDRLYLVETDQLTLTDEEIETLHQEHFDADNALQDFNEKHIDKGIFTVEQKARGTVLILLRPWNGEVVYEFLEPAKVRSLGEATRQVAAAEERGEEPQAEPEGKKTADELDYRQAEILVAQHAIACRDVVMNSPELAISLLVHHLAQIYSGMHDLRIDGKLHGLIENSHVDTPLAKSLPTNKAWDNVRQKCENARGYTFDDILGSGPRFQMDMLARIVAHHLGPIVGRGKRPDKAAQLVQLNTPDFNLRDWWTPDEAFLNLYRKDQLLDLLERFVGKAAIGTFQKMKKTELVEQLVEAFRAAASPSDRWKVIPEDRWEETSGQLNSWLPGAWDPIQVEVDPREELVDAAE